MRKTLLSGLLGLVALTGGAQAAVVAGTVQIYNGSQYCLVTLNTWEGAQAEAVSLGGNLVTINDAAEDAWVWQTYGSYLGDIGWGPWIGYNDIATEGTFVWASGETPGYTNWNDFEPNNAGDEDGVHYWPNGRWNDLPHSDRIAQYGVVEKPIPNGVPEGGAGLAMLALALGGLTALKRRMK